VLTKLLEYDKKEPKRRRRTAKKFFEELRSKGYDGSYDAVNDFVNAWKIENNLKEATAFVPLSFGPGEAFQFDWGTEEILLDGELTKIKVAQIRLCYSRFFLSVAYPNEQLEMVMDAHNKAFIFFNGICRKGIYDNMKTVIYKILIGKKRDFNNRFAQMASHYLFEPIACTPAAGWEKGQVENQVSTSRCNFFTPLVKVKTFEELNQSLEQLCLEWAKKAKHPEHKEQTVWEIFQQEKEHLLPYRYSFEGYKSEGAVVSSCCLVNFETNAYSVECEYVYKAAELRIYAKKVVIVNGKNIIGEHPRCFKRHKRIYNPWHYVSILERKPGALRNGAPFKDFVLPSSIQKIRTKLYSHPNGDKEFIKILLEVREHTLDKVDKICHQVLSEGVCNADLIVQRINQKPQENTEQELLLAYQSDSDCSCYDKKLLKQEKKND
jgi:transposase